MDASSFSYAVDNHVLFTQNRLALEPSSKRTISFCKRVLHQNLQVILNTLNKYTPYVDSGALVEALDLHRRLCAKLSEAIILGEINDKRENQRTIDCSSKYHPARRHDAPLPDPE